jgi:Nuclease-related domain
VPGADANLDHLVIGPTGVFVIDSKLWTGQVYQTADGLAWHNHYRLDRTLDTVRWEAETVSRLLGTRATALVCVHGAQVHGGGGRLRAWRSCRLGGYATPSARTGCCRTPMSSCWRPLPACGSGRPPDLAGSPFASAMVGEAARLGLDIARRSRLGRHVGGLAAASSEERGDSRAAGG